MMMMTMGNYHPNHHVHECTVTTFTLNLHEPLTGGGGGGGGGGGWPGTPLKTPTWLDPTAVPFPPTTTVAPGGSTAPGGQEGRMEMSPSPFLWILMVPCFSSSWIFFSKLLCRWMASSFSFSICRKESTCVLASLQTSCRWGWEGEAVGGLKVRDASQCDAYLHGC